MSPPDPFSTMGRRVPAAQGRWAQGGTRDDGIGRRMIVVMVLSCLAFLARRVELLLLLTGINAVAIFWLHRGPLSLRREMRTFAWQTAIILGLHLFRFRTMAGLWLGFKVSWQLFLALLPGMVFARTASQSGIVRVLTRVMPGRAAFVLSTCMRFIPRLLGEIKHIYEGQVLRGARILPRDLVRPWHWGDMLHCVVVPAVVQGMALAGHIALAARARGFERFPRRTCWPGE